MAVNEIQNHLNVIFMVRYTLMCVTDERKHAKSFSRLEDSDRAQSPKNAIVNGLLCPFCPTMLTKIHFLEEHILQFHEPLLQSTRYII